MNDECNCDGEFDISFEAHYNPQPFVCSLFPPESGEASITVLDENQNEVRTLMCPVVTCDEGYRIEFPEHVVIEDGYTVRVNPSCPLPAQSQDHLGPPCTTTCD